jgi:hypothetical protein
MGEISPDLPLGVFAHEHSEVPSSGRGQSEPTSFFSPSYITKGSD